MKAGDRPSGIGALLSQFEQRLRRLEYAQTVSIGPWRLTVDGRGALVATHAVSGVVRTVALPEEG